MRLIDADAFERSVMFGDAEDMQDVIYALRDYPTAYDLDKVVAQLEEFREEMEQFKCGGMLSDMIEVVKAGGVERQAQNYAKCVQSIPFTKNVSTEKRVNCRRF